MTVAIRPATADDAGVIAQIYNHYIRDTVATFETDTVTATEIAKRIAATEEAGLPWRVAADGGAILGYAYASRWKGRCAYRYSVESTIYLAPAETGRGIGRQLYGATLEAVRGSGVHVVIGGVSLPNDASVRLHEALGFKKIGQFEEVGYKFDRWIDVGYWQLTL